MKLSGKTIFVKLHRKHIISKSIWSWTTSSQDKVVIEKNALPFVESGAASRGCYGPMWRKVFAFTQGRNSWMGWIRTETRDHDTPKKVCVMCFFLPQVHRRKAQAQFPSFNRVAHISLSQCKKQVGWPPLMCKRGCFHKWGSICRHKDGIYANKPKQVSNSVERLHLKKLKPLIWKDAIRQTSGWHVEVAAPPRTTPLYYKTKWRRSSC